MSELVLTDRPRRGVCHDVMKSGQGVVIEVENEQVRLNATAFALWELCDGRTTVAEMVDAVCQLFDVGEERAAREVAGSIAMMREVGLVS